jgi:hypothetical protein
MNKTAATLLFAAGVALGGSGAVIATSPGPVHVYGADLRETAGGLRAVAHGVRDGRNTGPLDCPEPLPAGADNCAECLRSLEKVCK